jgi:hypothetical protein
MREVMSEAREWRWELGRERRGEREKRMEERDWRQGQEVVGGGLIVIQVRDKAG